MSNESYDPDTENQVEAKAELNIFVRSPHGFDGHIKVLVPQGKAAAKLLEISASLHEKDFEPSSRFGSGTRTAPAKETPPAPSQRPTTQRGKPAPKPRQAAQTGAPTYGDAETCGQCGSEAVSDAIKRTDQSPDLHCDDCTAGGWYQDKGGVKWLPPRN